MLDHCADSIGGLPGLGVVASLPQGVVRTSYTGQGAYIWTAPADGFVEIYAFAPGGGGRAANSGAIAGGGGGAGRFYPTPVKAGEQVMVNIGALGLGGSQSSAQAPAGDVVVTLPNGRVGRATGGRFGSSGSGGSASGFDLNSMGGNGGQIDSNTASTAGENEGGQPLGLSDVGGGVGGVGPCLPFAIPSNQSSGPQAGVSPGNGGGTAPDSSRSGGNGGSGRVFVMFSRTAP